MGIPVRGRLTTLRAAGAGDVERLVGWHLDPEVARYGDGPPRAGAGSAPWILVESRG